MACVERVPQMENFLENEVMLLQVVRLEVGGNAFTHFDETGVIQLHPREKIAQNVDKNGNIILHELRQVHVTAGLQTQLRFSAYEALALEETRLHEHGLDVSEREVVVVLLRELLLHELVQNGDLEGKLLGLLEALGEQRDLANQREVGNHHGNRTKEGLEVIGQLRATGVAWVHRHEDTAAEVEFDLVTLKAEPRQAQLHSVQDGEDLLRDDRKHLDLDTVELVEATPTSGLCKSAEHTAQALVVQTIGAIEHHHVLADGLPEILNGLRLARTGRALGQPAKVQLQCRRQCHVRAICQWCHDKTAAVAKVLVVVRNHSGRLLDHAHALLAVRHLLELKAQLLRPVEVVLRLHLGALQLVQDITRVDLDGDECDELEARQLRELPANHLGVALQQRLPLAVEAVDGVGLLAGRGTHVCEIPNSFRRLVRPAQLRCRNNVHALVVRHPILEQLLLAGDLEAREDLLDELVEHGAQVDRDGVTHTLGDPLQPGLDGLPLHLHRAAEGHLLTVGGDHALGVRRLLATVRFKAQFVDTFEAFAQVRLHLLRIAAVAKDLQQVVVGQEVEAGEELALVVEEVIEGSLDVFEVLRHAVELVEEPVTLRPTHHVAVGVYLAHDVAPLRIDGIKELRLFVEALFDVLGADEDVFKIHPLRLNVQQRVERVADDGQRLLPEHNLSLERSNEAGHLVRP
eukprot:PhM_4_TR1281/c1_g1_i1/m.7220